MLKLQQHHKLEPLPNHYTQLWQWNLAILRPSHSSNLCMKSSVSSMRLSLVVKNQVASVKDIAVSVGIDSCLNRRRILKHLWKMVFWPSWWSFLIITVLLLLNNLGLNYQNTTTRTTKGNHRHHGHNGQGKGGRVCFFSTPIFHLLTYYLHLELPQWRRTARPPPQHIGMAATAAATAAMAAVGAWDMSASRSPGKFILFYFARLTFLFFFTIWSTNRDDDERPCHHLNASKRRQQQQ